jgi:hypothetical protein
MLEEIEHHDGDPVFLRSQDTTRAALNESCIRVILFAYNKTNSTLYQLSWLASQIDWT